MMATYRVTVKIPEQVYHAVRKNLPNTTDKEEIRLLSLDTILRSLEYKIEEEEFIG